MRRWIENVLLFAGITALTLAIGGYALPIIMQDWGNWSFDREKRGEPVSVAQYLNEKKENALRAAQAWLGRTPSPPRSQPPAPPAPEIHRAPALARRPALRKNQLIGRLRIPRLGLSAIVREGTAEDTLSIAAGHIPATALPGEDGNVAVAGHRDTLFRGLRKVHQGDIIQFETLDRTYTYRVASTEIVKPSDVGVLKPGPKPELTLVTCYPFYYVGSAPDRFIVKAVQDGKTEEAARDDTEKLASLAARPVSIPPEPKPAANSFTIPKNHSRELAPGISMGVTSIDRRAQRVSGWMWIMPDRRTVWLKDQSVHDPVIFYRSGKRRELMITAVTDTSATARLVPE